MVLDERYTQVMLESLTDKVDTILEVLTPMAKDVMKLKSDVEKIDGRLAYIEKVVVVHDDDHKRFDRRITALEAAR